MKINDLKMATPIEEKIDQNLKVSLIDCDISSLSRRMVPHLFSPIKNSLHLGCILAGSYWNGDDKRRKK